MKNVKAQAPEKAGPQDVDAHPKYAVEGSSTPVGGGDDPFDLSNISVASVTAEDLGVEKPILVVPICCWASASKA